jgi:hypothetical protein
VALPEHLRVVTIQGPLHHDGSISALIPQVEKARMLNVIFVSKAKLTQSLFVFRNHLNKTLMMCKLDEVLRENLACRLFFLLNNVSKTKSICTEDTTILMNQDSRNSELPRDGTRVLTSGTSKDTENVVLRVETT